MYCLKLPFWFIKYSHFTYVVVYNWNVQLQGQRVNLHVVESLLLWAPTRYSTLILLKVTYIAWTTFWMSTHLRTSHTQWPSGQPSANSYVTCRTIQSLLHLAVGMHNNLTLVITDIENGFNKIWQASVGSNSIYNFFLSISVLKEDCNNKKLVSARGRVDLWLLNSEIVNTTVSMYINHYIQTTTISMQYF